MRKTKNIIIISIIASLGILFGAAGMYYGTTELGWFTHTTINKLEKEVTIEDKGIADAVEKLYDSVVIVQAYLNNNRVSSGTGFVYKTEGKNSYILTNSHVLSGVNKVKVTFTNGETYDANISGNDEFSDVAVLSIDSKKIIKVANIGSSERARLGDTAFTIGTPLTHEYSWTVTRGIISGKDRLIEINLANSNMVMSVLQTDAAINSGNSGGPIANANGEVIGITNMKLASGGVEGMGFAIPIEEAVIIGDKLIKNKTIVRPVLGVGTLNATDTEALARQYGIVLDKSVTSGATIATVMSGSPAAQAKLDKGDTVIKFGKYDITSSAKLKYYLYKYNVGDKVEVVYMRGKNKLTTTIELTKKA